MSVFYMLIRYFPFIAIPVALLLTELLLLFAGKKQWGRACLVLLIIGILVAANVLFFLKGGFINFIPWLKSEIDIILGKPVDFY